MKLIVACTRNGGIGLDGRIPWKLKGELKRFKDITSDGNNAVLMGRKTWESLPKKPLPNRKNIVISRKAKGAFRTIEDGIDACYACDEIFCIGGAEIYNYVLSKGKVDEIHLSMVKNDYECDTFINLDLMKKFALVDSIEYEDYIYYRYCLN